MKVLIGVPCMDTVPVDYVTSLLKLKTLPGTDIAHVPLCLVYVARDMIVDYAIQGGFTHVMFIDSDMVFPSDTMTKLLSHDKDIVSGLAFKRKPPYTPCIYKTLRLGEAGETICETAEDYTEGMNEVEAVGLACCLIKTEVFQKIRESGHKCFEPFKGLGEDLAFSFWARKLGYKIYADTDVKVGHIGQIVCGESTYKEWKAVNE